jgi:hypothetical protein
MADTKISDLGAASALAGADLIPVVQSGVNKKATATQASTFIRPWKEATFYIEQTATDAPVLTQMYNDTGATFTTTYDAVGAYTVTANSAVFTAGKTVAFIVNSLDDSTTKTYRDTDTAIFIRTFDGTGAPADTQLEAGISILIIKIYN